MNIYVLPISCDISNSQLLHITIPFEFMLAAAVTFLNSSTIQSNNFRLQYFCTFTCALFACVFRSQQMLNPFNHFVFVHKTVKLKTQFQ